MIQKTLVVGLGNPLLGDDGIGWRVAEEVGRLLGSGLTGLGPIQVEIDCLAVGGLALMERLVDYDRAILIDSIQTGAANPGTIWRFSMDDLPDQAAGHISSAHDTTLQTALKLGRSLGARLPEIIMVVAVEAQAVYDFSEELTHLVAAAFPAAVQEVLNLLELIESESTV